MVANKGEYDPIPVDQAIAYLVEVMPAFQYLHDLGLLYCDFKPDNIIQVGDAVKLIDLGGVRRIDDLDSAIYGTVGYQAPEVPDVGPSVASDLYTIGRTLVALATEFRGNQTTYVASLPPIADTPLFQRYDSLYRLLVKSCAPDPADRFASADEMRGQMLGVLREIVSADRPQARLHSTSSVLFDAPSVAGDTLGWRELPDLVVDDGDPMASWLSVLSVTDPPARLEELAKVNGPSVEVRLEMARTAIEAGRFDVLDATVAAILADDPWEWRAVWMQGLADLARDRAAAAQASFNAVYGQVPGELAPKLALALACEIGAEAEVAESLYQVCARTDANYTAPAAFGLARIRVGRKDLDGALVALDLVPATSRAYIDARVRRAQLLAGSGRGLADLAAAMASIDKVTIPPKQRAQISVEVLSGALEDVQRSGARDGVRIDGVPATEGALRDGLERAYRDLARLTPSPAERVALVDEANQVRRWTWR
jgi:serine/threonine-protein kinase PknG